MVYCWMQPCLWRQYFNEPSPYLAHRAYIAHRNVKIEDIIIHDQYYWNCLFSLFLYPFSIFYILVSIKFIFSNISYFYIFHVCNFLPLSNYESFLCFFSILCHKSLFSGFLSLPSFIFYLVSLFNLLNVFSFILSTLMFYYF